MADSAKTLFDAAVQAKSLGRPYFTPSFTTSFYRFNSTSAMDDWAIYLGAVEQAGWKLRDWTVTVDQHGHPVAWPLFVPA
jgi:hypothetical protein